MPHRAAAGPSFDPLAERRGTDGPRFDLFLNGTVFLDIVFTGLEGLPTHGREVWAEGMGSCPGGIANLAVAASRLGLYTSLGAAFSEDDYGYFCWRVLEQEGVDLSTSRRYPDWHSPVTVSFAVDGDRNMVTHGHEEPECPSTMIGHPPPARVVLMDLSAHHPGETLGASWVDQAHADGALIFADVGCDPTGRWDPSLLDSLSRCHAFTPNAVEAMRYTRTDTPQDALYALADRVPLAVVTNGPFGALAYDSSTGEEAHVPALKVEAIDPTGAGDVFAAAMVLGTLGGWALAHRLAFAALCSSLSVQQVGGSLAAPGWGDIADWWHLVRDSPTTSAYHLSLRRRYAFLDDLVPEKPFGVVHRAQATIARLSDA
ncbi:Sugar or nucleoside kinase, ribokinase family [Austwickia chelonae]|uniref:Putative carbohydrate kinase n=1 Tax=Austwickia chelonae NBRC 105200 TaxID=1184607 RepID=K6UN56_9MICO|nr:PfkB family carbohydrate kinase [Austwickia chelonae]GAB78701.1 putative carbohydrate kinase [Austwickia chelonae NBRC 105200]SEW34839.1 Sugar or nucleoside kinase, ribokinase family [Austwickia chelonae]